MCARSRYSQHGNPYEDLLQTMAILQAYNTPALEVLLSGCYDKAARLPVFVRPGAAFNFTVSEDFDTIYNDLAKTNSHHKYRRPGNASSRQAQHLGPLPADAYVAGAAVFDDPALAEDTAACTARWGAVSAKEWLSAARSNALKGVQADKLEWLAQYFEVRCGCSSNAKPALCVHGRQPGHEARQRGEALQR